MLYKIKKFVSRFWKKSIKVNSKKPQCEQLKHSHDFNTKNKAQEKRPVRVRSKKHGK
jgi:hypothetical protein